MAPIRACHLHIGYPGVKPCGPSASACASCQCQHRYGHEQQHSSSRNLSILQSKLFTGSVKKGYICILYRNSWVLNLNIFTMSLEHIYYVTYRILSSPVGRSALHGTHLAVLFWFWQFCFCWKAESSEKLWGRATFHTVDIGRRIKESPHLPKAASNEGHPKMIRIPRRFGWSTWSSSHAPTRGTAWLPEPIHPSEVTKKHVTPSSCQITTGATKWQGKNVAVAAVSYRLSFVDGFFFFELDVKLNPLSYSPCTDTWFWRFVYTLRALLRHFTPKEWASICAMGVFTPRKVSKKLL
jgi:hypothetical protein